MQVEIEVVKLLLVFVLLGVNVFYDLKYRKIFGSDKINFILGCGALSLFLITLYDNPNFLTHLIFLIGSLMAILFLWKVKAISDGDVIVCVIFSLLLPIFFIPITTIFMAVFLLSIVIPVYNVSMNCITLMNHKPLFSSFNSSTYVKCLAFCFSHRKRQWEKFVVSIECNDNTLQNPTTVSPYDKDFTITKNTVVVMALPFLLFVLLSLPIALSLTSAVMRPFFY